MKTLLKDSKKELNLELIDKLLVNTHTSSSIDKECIHLKLGRRNGTKVVQYWSEVSFLQSQLIYEL